MTSAPVSAPVQLLILITELERGGAERVVVHLARHLDRRLVAPSVATIHAGGELSDEITKLGVRVSHLSRRRNITPGSVFALRRLLTVGGFNVIHSHLPAAGLVARLALTYLSPRPAHVYTEHNVPRGYGLLSRAVNRWPLQEADRITAVSHEVRSAWLRSGSRRHLNSEVVWNGVEIPALSGDSLTRARVRQELELDERELALIAVGNLHHRKGHAVLLQAFEKARLGHTSVLLLVGDGPLLAELETMARSLGIGGRVRFLGRRRDVEDLLFASDVFVLPSLAEGLPMALLEAMARGLPCIASAVGGVPEALADGIDGHLVPPGDVDTLAARLASVEDASTRLQLGDAARLHAMRDFRVEQMVQRYESLYMALARARQP
jgi:glycosyltransferase involved in cell wall biosynthesis